MGVLSEEYIMGRLKKYVQTKQGKARILQYRKDVFEGKIANDKMLTKEIVTKTLADVRDALIRAIHEVIITFRGDLVYTSFSPMDDDGRVKASVTVDEDALRRESLHYMKQGDKLTISHGEGVRDILALFTHGYTLDKRPYGFWVRDNVMADIGQPLTRIGALTHRDPNPFLLTLVDELNKQYSGVCEITLSNKYIHEGGD